MEVGANTPHSTNTTNRTAPTSATPPSKPATTAPPPVDPARKLTEVAADFSNEKKVGLSPLPDQGAQQPTELYKNQNRKKEEAARLDEALRQAHGNELPEQVKRKKESAARVQQQQDGRYADKEKQRAAITAEQQAAEQKYEAAKQRASKGWRPENEAFKNAEKNFIGSAQKMAKFFAKHPGAEPELREHLELRERANEVGQPGGPTAEEFKKQVQDGERALMNKFARQDGVPMRSDAQDQLTMLLTDHDKLQGAKKLITAQERQAWMASQLGERDKTRGTTAEQSRQNEKSHAADRDKVASDTAAINAAADKKVTDQLQAASDQAHSVKQWDLSKPLKEAEALPPKAYYGRDTADGVEFRSEDGKEVLATIKEGQDKKVTVSCDVPEQAGKSVLTPAGNGRYTEESTVKHYHTSGKPGSEERKALKNETITHKDADGKLTYERVETPGKDGAKQIQTTTDEGGVNFVKYETLGKDGKLKLDSTTRKETIDGVPVETQDSSVDDSAFHTVTKTPKGGPVTKAVTHTTPKDQYVTTTVTQPDGSSKIDKTSTATGSKEPYFTETTTLDKHGNGTRIGKGDGYESKTEIEHKDGKKTETEVRTEKGKVTTTISVDGKEQSSVTVADEKTNPNVPGFEYLFSHSPQDLVQEQMGKEEEITTQRITESALGKDGEMVSRETVKMTSGDKDRELLETKAADGGKIWTLRKKNGDNWDTQTFFQGSKDTITNTHSKDQNGFNVQTEVSRTPKLAEDSSTLIPHSSDTKIHTHEAASADALNKMLVGHKMADVRKSDTFKEFMRQTGNGTLKVVAQDGVSQSTGQPDKQTGSLILESSDGRRLTAVYDPAQDAYLVQNESKDSKEPLNRSVLKGDERLEIDAQGNAREFKKDPVVWTQPARDMVRAASWPKETGETIEDAAAATRGVARKMGAAENSRLVRAPGAVADSELLGIATKANGSGFAALSALSLAADITNGDWNRVAEKGGSLGMDLAELRQSFDKSAGRAGGLVGKGSQIGLVGAGARVLGVAGALTGAFFAGGDFAEEKYVKGSLGLIGSGFGLYSMAFGGPVGWGVAGVAGLASVAWEYNEETKIADLQI